MIIEQILEFQMGFWNAEIMEFCFNLIGGER